MPYEYTVDLNALGTQASTLFTAFAEKTGRSLTIEIEPGTYIMGNSG
jgi:hypothetical protein